MSDNYFAKGLVVLLFTIVQSSFGQTVMHYWNFNNNASVAAISLPSQTFGGATLNAILGGISLIDFTIQGTIFISGGDTTAPTATFLPADGVFNVLSSVNPTIILMKILDY